MAGRLIEPSNRVLYAAFRTGAGARGMVLDRGPDLSVRITAEDEARAVAARGDIQIEHDAFALQPDFGERARLSRQSP